MLPYALSKILGTQFIVTGFTLTQIQSLEDVPGTTLAWAFLGKAVWFQIFIGFVELIPSILLLFRKTILLGAVLMLPVTLNVLLINYALDLWPDTKVMASGLFTLNLFILIFEWEKIIATFKIVISQRFHFKLFKLEIVFNLILVSIVSYLALDTLLEYRNQRNELTGDWVNQHPIEWILTKEEIGDSTLTARDLKIYFGAYGAYDESGPTSNTLEVSYTVNTANRTITFKYDDGNVLNCNYEKVSENDLKLIRQSSSLNNSLFIQYFSKRIINK
ncbi:MAG: hypothetical protein WKF66_16355 [Pedobacter sp.]